MNTTKARKAASKRPRHRRMADKLRSLLTWRAALGGVGTDWTAVADNDNDEDAVPLLDTKHEVRPRISEFRVALKEVDMETRRHARLGGDGAEFTVPVGGDMERGPVLSQGKKPACVVRLGHLRFSNGAQVERGPVLRDGRVVTDDITIPLGGLVEFNGRFRPRDRFGAPRGANTSAATPNVLPSLTASSGAFLFNDPVAANDNAKYMREAVKPETADLLDLACRASNFQQLGEHLGYYGKTAQRQGKKALLAACEELEKIIAA